MLSILALGFLIGLQHALEADHLAAVASLATRSSDLLDGARQAAVWGLGHTLSLFLFGGAVLVTDNLIPEHIASGLEMVVGVMLILLGGDVLRRVIRGRVHFHTHRPGSQEHFYVHSHLASWEHAEDPHHHQHGKTLPVRALLVGMTHGMAGSAALILLALAAVTSPLQGLAYISLFGFGSVVGAITVGAVISLPLRYSPRSLTWAQNGLQTLIGLLTLGLGGYILYDVGLGGGPLT